MTVIGLSISGRCQALEQPVKAVSQAVQSKEGEGKRRSKAKTAWGAIKFFPKFLRLTAKHMVHKRSLITLGATALASYGVSHFNDQISGALKRDDFRRYTEFGREYYGAYLNMGAPQLSIYALGAAFGNDAMTGTGYSMMGAFALERLTTGILQTLTGDSRPDPRVASNPTRGTFPSGHTASAATFAGVMQGRHGFKYAAPFHAAALYTGMTRIADGAHRPHEVVAGLGIGYAIGLAADEAWEEVERDYPDVVLLPKIDLANKEYGLALQIRF